MFDTITPLSPFKLTDAVNQAGANIRSFFKDDTIRLVLITPGDEGTLKAVRKTHQRRWDNKQGSSWGVHFYDLENHPNQFIVPMYKKSLLTGLCLFDLAGACTTKERLRINTVDRNHANDDFKGYVIATAAEIGLRVAQRLSFEKFTVLSPKPKTLATYLRLGFKDASSDVPLSPPSKEPVELIVDDRTTLDLAAQQRHVLTRKTSAQPATL